ncbi:bifunctional DNA primase/polymerase [Propionibacteriaceae bacterium Y2011]
MTTIVAAAIAWYEAGCMPVPTALDGSKMPAIPWKGYQNERPDLPTVLSLFTRPTDGLGIITGPASNNTLMLELEGRAVDAGMDHHLAQIFHDHALDALWAKINSYSETTPSGGIHWYVRVDGDELPGNQKLARRPATPDELTINPKEKLKVLAETRGRGGFSVVAPSHGRTHPTGQPWTATHGTPADIPTLTTDELDAVLILFGMLDQTPDIDTSTTQPIGTTRTDGDPLRPGDDYNTRATWTDILTPHGWKPAKKLGRAIGWVRPGKTDPGISATTGRNDADNLYVFSSSTEFEQEKPYSKFGAYAVLEHGGDHADAARALRAAGYGDPSADGDGNAAVLTLTQHAGGNQPNPVDGTSALKIDIVGSDIPQAHTTSLTDQGNADLLVELHGHTMRWVAARGQWLHWTGTHWQWSDDDGEVIQHAAHTIRAIHDTTDPVKKHKTRSLSRRGLEAMVRLARANPAIRVTPDQLDADPWVLNTPGGLVNLRDGTIRPTKPVDLCTRITQVDVDYTPPNPMARIPRRHLQQRPSHDRLLPTPRRLRRLR